MYKLSLKGKIGFVLIVALILSMIPILSFGNDEPGGSLTGNTGINVKLFNYGKGINDTESRTGFGFFDNGERTVDFSRGKISSNGTKTITTNTLDSDGYPVISASNKSMGYLFKPEDVNAGDYDNRFNQNNKDVNYTKKYLEVEDNNGLFVKDKDTGYYSYDSAKNHAYYNPTSKKFELYDYLLRPGFGTENGKKADYGNFLPFNMPTENAKLNTSDFGDYYNTLTRTEAAATKNPALYATDLWFGMSVEFDFFQPRDGKVNNNNMEFAFEGDDDVFVYIDGIKILDLGGAHETHKGTIDFATGKVDNRGNDTTLYKLYNDAVGATKAKTVFTKNNEGNWIFEDYTNHEFKFFYMERGGSLAHCSLLFNMPVVENPYPLIVEKKVTGDPDKPAAENDEFDYILYTDAAANDSDNRVMTPAANVGYRLYSGDNLVDTTMRYTDQNGKFKLIDGLNAVFSDGAFPDAGTATEQAFSENVKFYRVEEINIDTDEFTSVKATNEYMDYTEKDVTSGEKVTSLSTKDYTEFRARSYVKFENERSNPQEFRLKKEVNGTSDKSKEFSFEVMIGGSLYNGEYVVEKNTRTAQNGIIKLKADETAVFNNIKPGVKVTVSEKDIPKFYTTNKAEKTVTMGSDGNTTMVFTNTYAKSDLDASKSSNTSETTAVWKDDKIKYTITVENDSNVTATGVVVRDEVPAFTKLVSIEDNGFSGPGEKEDYVAWYIDKIAPGKSKSVSFTVKITDEFTLDNQIRNTAYYEET